MYHLNKPGSKDLDGPHTIEAVHKLLEEKKYVANDNVWNAEKKVWQLVKEVPALNRKIRQLAEKESNKLPDKPKQSETKANKGEVKGRKLDGPNSKQGITGILTEKGDQFKRVGKKAIQDKIVKDVEVRKSKIEYSTSDLKTWIKRAFSELFGRLPNKRWPNFVYLGIFIIPTIFFSIFSYGILIGPMAAGYLLLILNVINGKTTRFRFGDLIAGDRFFVRTFWIGLSLNIFPLLILWLILQVIDASGGSLLGILLMLGLSCLFGLIIAVEFFSFMLILERQQKWNEALLHSFGFLKGGLLRVVPVIGIIGAVSCMVGFFAIYVGLLITLPLYIIFLVHLFRHCSCQYFGLPQLELDSKGPELLSDQSSVS